MFNIETFAVLAAAISFALASPAPVVKAFTFHPPAALPACPTREDAKWQPVMDFDKDSCYNTPAIGPDGTLATGLNNCHTTATSQCRDERDLENNNVYARSRCNNGWCAHMYAYYFEKDVVTDNSAGYLAGHLHDWEHVVVWVKDEQVRYVAVSDDGKYRCRPAKKVRMDGDHAKIVYHKKGRGTHAFRFATKKDDKIENHKNVWFAGDLVSYSGFPGKLRDIMLNKDWGKTFVDLKDDRFADALKAAKGDYDDITLDPSFDDDHFPTGTPLCKS